MTLKQIAAMGKRLIAFLNSFTDCFGRREPRELLQVYLKGQLSDLHRKNAEAIGLKFGRAPRTLQRFLSSIKWDEEKMRDRCQQIIAQEHSHPEAIGIVDESGVPKSGKETVGVARQWCGHEGKVDNCVVGVHLGYAAPEFQCLISSALYLPEDWANDPARRKTHYVPEEIKFRTKQQIAMELIDQVEANGICVAAWAFDEFYGRDGNFLNGLSQRGHAFVGEIPKSFCGWVVKPAVITSAPLNQSGDNKKYPRLACRGSGNKVENLVEYSPAFREQSWQRYRIKDTNKGPEVWEVKWSEFWRKEESGLPTRQHTLIVARNVLTGEVKYFLSNRVPGSKGTTLRWLLRVAFGRWAVESCFREAKEELGMDHYQMRGWRGVHRHLYLTQLSHLFCAQVRQEYDHTNSKILPSLVPEPNTATGEKPASKQANGTEHKTSKSDFKVNLLGRLTFEQIRSAMNAWLEAALMTPAARRKRYEQELNKQRYYQRRNLQAQKSHTKTQIAELQELGIDVGQIKSCILKLHTGTSHVCSHGGKT